MPGNEKKAEELIAEVKRYPFVIKVIAALAVGVAVYFVPYTFNLRLKILLKNEIVHVMVSFVAAVAVFFSVLSPRKAKKSDFGV